MSEWTPEQLRAEADLVRLRTAKALRSAAAEIERLRAAQSSARETIYSLLADDDLTDEKLRAFSENELPRIHDALHIAEGYAPSECFTEEAMGGDDEDA